VVPSGPDLGSVSVKVEIIIHTIDDTMKYCNNKNNFLYVCARKIRVNLSTVHIYGIPAKGG